MVILQLPTEANCVRLVQLPGGDELEGIIGAVHAHLISSVRDLDAIRGSADKSAVDLWCGGRERGVVLQFFIGDLHFFSTSGA